MLNKHTIMEIYMCGDTHTVALLPPSSSLWVSAATLSLSFLSSSICNPSLRSQFQTKRSFPSRHLNKSIHSTSHAYQICQLTNGRAGRTARSLYKRPCFQPENHWTPTSRRYISKDQSAPKSRRNSQLQHQGLGSSVHQEGPNTSGTDSQFWYCKE